MAIVYDDQIVCESIDQVSFHHFVLIIGNSHYSSLFAEYIAMMNIVYSNSILMTISHHGMDSNIIHNDLYRSIWWTISTSSLSDQCWTLCTHTVYSVYCTPYTQYSNYEKFIPEVLKVCVCDHCSDQMCYLYK